MHKLVLAHDDDDIWKIVDLREDGSYGYTNLTSVPGAGDYGFIIETRSVPTNSDGSIYAVVNRVLFYDYKQPMQQISRTMANSQTQTLPYFELAELIPFPTHSVAASSITAVGWQMLPELWNMALADWNQLMNPVWVPQPVQQPMLMISEPDWLATQDALMQQQNQAQQHGAYITFLQQQMGAQQARIDVLTRMVQQNSEAGSVRSSDSPFDSDVAARSYSSSDASAASTSPKLPTSSLSPLPSIESVPAAKKTLAKIIAKDLQKAAQQMLQRQQAASQKRLFKNQLRDLLRSGDVATIYNFLLENEVAKTTLNRAELLKDIDLPLAICIKILAERGNKKVAKNHEVQQLKINHALLSRLVSYPTTEYTPESMPEFFQNISSKLNDAALHLQVVPLVNKYKIPAKVKATATPALPPAPPPAVKIKKAAAKQLTSQDYLNNAIAANDGTAFNQLITAANVNKVADLTDSLADKLIKHLQFGSAAEQEFIRSVSLSDAVLQQMVRKGLQQLSAEKMDLIFAKLIELPDADFLLLVAGDLMYFKPFQDLVNVAKQSRRAIFTKFDSKLRQAAHTMLAEFAQRLRTNPGGLQKELEKFPRLINMPDANGELLLEIALDTPGVPKTLLNFLIQETGRAIGRSNAVRGTILHRWVASRPKKINAEELQIFSKIFQKYVANFPVEFPSDITLTPATKATYIQDSKLAIQRYAAALRNQDGNTLLHNFLAINRKLPDINALLEAIIGDRQESESNEHFIICSLLLLGKNAAGENPYTLLEKSVLELGVAELSNIGITLNIIGKQVEYLATCLNARDLNLPADYYGAEFFDFFNSKKQPTLIATLIDKLPDQKSAARLQFIIQQRDKIRGNIHAHGTARQKYFGLNDAHTELLRILQTGSNAESDAQARVFLNKWLPFEAAANVGSVLYTALYAMSEYGDPKDALQVWQYALNSKLVTLILAADPENISKYTHSNGNTCLWPAMLVVADRSGDKSSLEIMRAVITSGINLLAQNTVGNNILHIMLAGYAGGAFSLEAVRAFTEAAGKNVIAAMLEQQNNDKLKPIDGLLKLSAQQKAPILDLLLPPQRQAARPGSP